MPVSMGGGCGGLLGGRFVAGCRVVGKEKKGEGDQDQDRGPGEGELVAVLGDGADVVYSWRMATMGSRREARQAG